MNTFSKYDTQKVKGLAIILMMIHHCFLDAERYAGHTVSFFPFSEETVNYWALFFKICVGMFVFITGYGLTLSFRKENSKYQFTPKECTDIVITRYIKLISGFMFTLVCVWIYSFIANTGWFKHEYGTGLKSCLYAIIDLFGLSDLLGTPTYVATFWFMTLAQLIIFVMPLLILCYKKLGAIPMYLLMLTISVTIPFSYPMLPRYIVCATLGMICADNDLLVKIRNYNPIKEHPIVGKVIKFVVDLLLIWVLAHFRQSGIFTKLIGLWDSIIPMLVIVFCFEFLNNIPIIKNILSIIGKYSMYIFLTHNFIRICWYNDFTYSFYYAPLIVIVLLVVSLGVSIIIDTLRKITRFDKLVQFTTAKVRTLLDKVF